MLYAENTPRSLPNVTREQQLVNNDGVPKMPKRVLDTEVFDRLHLEVYRSVQPETHGERRFLTRCIQAVLEVDGQWTEEETMKVLNALLESRQGLKVMVGQQEFINDDLPDCQVA